MPLWNRLHDLPLRVEGLRSRPLDLRVRPSWRRRTVEVALHGAGLLGLGEDSGWSGEAHEALLAASGPWSPRVRTLGEFSRWLEEPPKGAEVLVGAPADTDAGRARRWALESAALDLALRQAGLGLGEVLGREALPLRFVASLSPRTPEEVTARLARVPGLRLKLDASPRWTEHLLRELGRSGAVEVVDFKGAPGDPEHLELLERVLEHLPGVLLEDPPVGAEAETILERAAASVALDAGMLTPADLERAGPRVVAVSAKPARVGSLGAHLALVESALARGLRVHGGGRFELGVGRRQLQALAALLHPDAPNDLAPVEHHAREGAGPLPASPLAVSVGVPGFGAM